MTLISGDFGMWGNRKRLDKSDLPFSDKYIFMLMIPMIIETFLNVFIGIADTIMVSSAGEAAISGVSVVDSLILLFTLVITCFSSGGAVVFSQHLGARNEDAAKKAGRLLLQISFLLGVLGSVMILAFRNFFLHLLMGNAEEAVMEAAIDYLIPIALSLPFLAITSSATALSRSMGQSKIAMLIALLMNVLNVIGNAILIYIYGMGALGAGIASLFSRIVAALVMIWILYSDRLPLKIDNLVHIQFDIKLVESILHIAVPTTLENGVFHIGKLIIMGIVASLGTTAMAANAAVNSLITIVTLPGVAMNMAIIPLVSHCCGAGRYDQAEYYAKKILSWQYIAFLMVCPPFLFCMRPCLSMYNLGPDALDLAVHCFFLLALHTLLFWPVSFALPSCLEAAGDVIYPMVLAIVSMWVFRVGNGYVLSVRLDYGLIGVQWAMFFDWYCRIIFLVGRFLSGKWKNRKVI